MASVDNHLHVNYNGFSLGAILKYLDRDGIDFAWLLSWEEIDPGPRRYKHLPVEDIYEAYVKYPSRFIPFYAPDPRGNDAAVKLEKWQEKGIRGCGELKSTLNWGSAQVKAILDTTRKLKMPVLFHMEESRRCDVPYSDKLFDVLLFYGLRSEKKIHKIPQSILRLLVKNYMPLRNRNRSFFFPGYMLDMATLEQTLHDYPDVNFVAHGQMFWKHISADGVICNAQYPKGLVNGEGIIWRLLGDYPNLYADTSGPSGFNALTRDPDNTKRFLSMFEDKIIYGTDNFMFGQKQFLGSLSLSKDTYKKIYGDNACRLIKI